MDEVREECGLAAVSLPENMKVVPFGGAASYLYKMLLQQQHRGQHSAGITTYEDKRTQLIDTYKEIGMVNEVFRSHHRQKNQAILKEYSGSKGIGWQIVEMVQFCFQWPYCKLFGVEEAAY